MTKRKPLGWSSSDYGPLPTCDACLYFLLAAPYLREAASSVAIETGRSSTAIIHRVVDKYHADRHQEL